MLLSTNLGLVDVKLCLMQPQDKNEIDTSSLEIGTLLLLLLLLL